MHERHLFRSLQIDCAGGSLDSPPKIRLSGDGIPKATRKAKPLMKNLPRDRCRKSPGDDFELCQTFKFPAITNGLCIHLHLLGAPRQDASLTLFFSHIERFFSRPNTQDTYVTRVRL